MSLVWKDPLETLGTEIGEALYERLAQEEADEWAVFGAFLFAVCADFVGLFVGIFVPLELIPFLGVAFAFPIHATISAIGFVSAVVITIILWNVGGFIKIKVRIALYIASFFEVFATLLLPLGVVPFYTICMFWAYLKIRSNIEEMRRGMEIEGLL